MTVHVSVVITCSSVNNSGVTLKKQLLYRNVQLGLLCKTSWKHDIGCARHVSWFLNCWGKRSTASTSRFVVEQSCQQTLTRKYWLFWIPLERWKLSFNYMYIVSLQCLATCPSMEIHVYWCNYSINPSNILAFSGRQSRVWSPWWLFLRVWACFWCHQCAVCKWFQEYESAEK